MVLFRLFITLGRPFINKDCLKEEGEKLGFTEAGKQESLGRRDSESYRIREEDGGSSDLGTVEDRVVLCD